MPIETFEGYTWVAFIDLCGFKKMVPYPETAKAALNKFYNLVFNVNKTYHETKNNMAPKIQFYSLMVSDCAVIFVDDRQRHIDDVFRAKAENLNVLLWAINTINRYLINPNNNSPQLMTTSAIDYGYFEYAKRNEDQHTEKNLFFGQAYVNAFLETERNGKGGLKNLPGYCKILDTTFDVKEATGLIGTQNQLAYLKKNKRGYDYFWMTIDPNRITEFQNEYKQILSLRPKNDEYYNRLKQFLRTTSEQTLR